MAQQTTTATLHTETRGSAWADNINAEVDVTFADANAARYFNTGGEILTADLPTTSTDPRHKLNTVFDTAMGTPKWLQVQQEQVLENSKYYYRLL